MRISDWSSDVCSSDLQDADLLDDVGKVRGEVFVHARVSRARAVATSSASAPRAARMDSPTGSPSTSAPGMLTCGKPARPPWAARHRMLRSEEHTSELQSLMRISYAVFCLKKKKNRHADTFLPHRDKIHNRHTCHTTYDVHYTCDEGQSTHRAHKP